MLEARTLLAVSILNGGGLGYVGNGGGGPPDVTGAAGPDSYMEVTNSTITIFNKTDPRTIVASHGIGDFFYNPTIGNLTKIDAGSCGVCDSTGIFDNLMGGDGRFIIGDIDVDGTTNVSQYIFAVSKSSNPTTLTTADWNFYHVTTTQTVGSTTNWTDYPGNPGFNADAFVETFNLANGCCLTGNAEILSINATDLANGVSQASLHTYQNFISGSNSYRPVTMHDAAPGDPMWLIRNPNDGTHIDAVKMTNVLSNSASFTTTPLALPAADNFIPSGINNPLNPDDTPLTDGDVDNPDSSPASDVDNRILKAGEYNNTIAAAHKVAVGTASFVSATVQLDSLNNPIGGSGYTVGDILTVTGGTFTTAATLKVATLGAGGSVATVTVANSGNYSSLAGISGAVTGGSGSGAKFNFNFRGELDVQWYAIDVSGATPAFQLVGGQPNVGRIGFGANTYSVEPAIDINSSGQIGLGFMESDTVGGAINAATGGFLSTFVTARQPTDAAGTMQPVVLVPAGTGTGNINGRIGDFSGMNVDPVNGTFWHVNEFGGGGPTDIAHFTPNAPPVVTPPANQNSDEGAGHTFSLGSFTDPDGGPWTVDVTWGDGTPDTIFNTSAPGTIASESHKYGEEGAYTATIKVTDTFEGQFGSKTFAVNVRDPAVKPASSVPVVAIEGAAFGPTALATFTDPGGAEPNPSDKSGTLDDHYKVVSIDWGDSTPLDTTSGAISYSGAQGSTTDPFTVSGSHAYGEEGSYTIHVIIDHEGVDTTLTDTATVTDPPVKAASVPVFGTACSPLTGVALATFIDPGGAEPNPSDKSGTLDDHYKVVSIDWGDSTPLDTTSGAISYSGTQGSTTDPFTVSGTHTYETEGTYTITVKLDHEGIATTVTTTAIIKDKLGLLLLDPAGSQSLAVTGNGQVTVNGDCGAVVVNSTAGDAAFVTGNGMVTAGDFDVTGGVAVHGHGVVPSPVDHEAPTADPLGLGLPSPLPPAPSGNTSSVLNPGTYVGGIHINGNGAVTLKPGVYVMEGGGFSVSGKASVTGSGVVIVNIPGGPGDTISVTGQAVVSLTAPTGGTYQGVAVLQLDAAPVSFSGQASVAIAGVFYTPNAPVSIAGNADVTLNAGAGTASLPPIFAAMIAFDLQVSGNGVLTINPDDPSAGPMAAASVGRPDVMAAAIDALAGSGSSGGADQQAINELVMSLGVSADVFGGAKKKSS